jgi:hypothetical protein
MPTTTIRPASTQADGFIRSDSATYATARGSYVAGTVNNGNTTFITGQRLSAGTYNLFQGFIGDLDLSVIPAAAVVTGVTFEYTTNSSTISAASDLEMLGFDAGATVLSGDYQNGTAVAGLTNYGTIDATANNAATTTYQQAMNAAGIAAVQAAVTAAGKFGIALIATDFVNNVAPSGEGRYTIRASEDATAAYRPALIIDYRMPPVMDHLYRTMRAA